MTLAVKTYIDEETCDMHDLGQLIDRVCKSVPPMWGLQNFVAVNPYWGFRENHFLSTDEELRLVDKSSILMPVEFYRKEYDRGSLTEESVSNALSKLLANSSKHIGASNLALTLEGALTYLKSGATKNTKSLKTFSEYFDSRESSNVSETIVFEITKFLGLYFDRQQAIWQLPFNNLELFHAWKNYISVDKSLVIELGPELNKEHVKQALQGIPSDFKKVPAEFIELLGCDDETFVMISKRLLSSVKGWASYLQHLVFEDAKRGVDNTILKQLLSMRLYLEMVVLKSKEGQRILDEYKQDFALGLNYQEDKKELAYRYLFQLALEDSYKNELLSKLEWKGSGVSTKPELQAIFCIDVRSESIRRKLEEQSSNIETYGFAGFFGLAFKVIRRSSRHSVSQYPVLLDSNYTATLLEKTKTQARLTELKEFGLQLVKCVRQSVVSGFNYVESLGLFYIVKMIRDSFGLGGQKVLKSDAGYDLVLELSFEEQLKFAISFLKNSSLRTPYANTVLVCGHAAETVNNPYRAGLDCGACGGHSGEFNAIAASLVLNDAKVRKELELQGYSIPTDTQFVPCIHNTTTDEIIVLGQNQIPDNILQWLKGASGQARKGRASSLGIEKERAIDKSILKKSRDWSEVRPEWGLAGNAAFIAGRRELTKKVDLSNRSFLHEYNFSRDNDLSILELIMTAPMVVASWINLQYYASSLDPEINGSGTKVIHNVTGQLGVVSGNGGDLRVGLPFQSVHTGKELFAAPLRLQVFLEAPLEAIHQVVGKHQLLKDLIRNEWISVYALNQATAEAQPVTID